MRLTRFADHPLAQRRTWRLIVLTVSGVPVALAGMLALGLLAGVPLFVLASDVLRARPEAAAWAAASSLVGFPMSLAVVAADREWCRLWVDRPVALRWERRRWSWRRLVRVPADAATWRRLLWLLLRVLIGLVTAFAGWYGVQGVAALATAPLRAVTPWSVVAPVGGLLLAYVMVQAARGTGWLLHQMADELLGPSPQQRIARLEQRAVDLSERARLARELHDSVGHTVTVVVLQAAAARQVLDSDPRFVAEALGAIEDAGRRAVGELADVLRLLRAEPPGRTAGPGLERLDELVASIRGAGLPVSLVDMVDATAVPEPVSRVAYRVVQEACTNIMRHAGMVPAEVRVRVDGRRLLVGVYNGPGRSTVAQTGAGHGLRGLRERVESCGGALQAGPDEKGFHVVASIPVG